jgi:hypothetical protein
MIRLYTQVVIFLGAERWKFFTKKILNKKYDQTYLYFLARRWKIFLQRKSLIKNSDKPVRPTDENCFEKADRSKPNS